MNVSPLARLRTSLVTMRWSALIPARAVAVEIGATSTRYLHPTKGWRTVSHRRLGV